MLRQLLISFFIFTCSFTFIFSYVTESNASEMVTISVNQKTGPCYTQSNYVNVTHQDMLTWLVSNNGKDTSCSYSITLKSSSSTKNLQFIRGIVKPGDSVLGANFNLKDGMYCLTLIGDSAEAHLCTESIQGLYRY